MVDNLAIVAIVNEIICNRKDEIHPEPCKKMLQKIVFLIEEKNLDLGCDYTIHFYGPYSADLDYAVRKLSDEDILKIDYTPTAHLISIKDRNFIQGYSSKLIEEVVKEFSHNTPNELELITTALYAYKQLNNNVAKIKENVIKIKGNKYSNEKIDKAIERLKELKYIE